MTIETANYINQLNTSYPRDTDLLKEGDDHIRMIKNVLRSSFPQVNKTVNLTADDMNGLKATLSASQNGITLQKGFTVSSGQQIQMGRNRVMGVADPAAGDDAVTMNYMFKQFLNTLYPVGAIYITTGATPQSIMGGTWEQVSKGRFLLGTGDSGLGWNVGNLATGGQTSFTIHPQHLPQHTHNMNHGHGARTTSGGEHEHTYDHWQSRGFSGQGDIGGNWESGLKSFTTRGGGGHGHGVQVDKYSGSTGGVDGLQNQSIGYVPLYYGVTVWRRTGLA